MDSSLTLVVPCYNEAQRLDLTRFNQFLATSPDVTILFVDDGSSDETGQMLEQFAHTVGDGARVLRLAQNKGKAEAVRLGLLHAMKEDVGFVGFWDADLATPLPVVLDMLGELRRRDDVDWVLGARVRLLGRNIQRRATRHYLGRVFATAASLVLGMPVFDTQCGAKVFRANDDLRAIIAQPFLGRWIFDVELLSRFGIMYPRGSARSAESRVFELPVPEWIDVPGSKVRPTDFIRAVGELYNIWRAQRAARS
jgi:glycosyltransferase involved in cell wall biosynthesis